MPPPYLPVAGVIQGDAGPRRDPSLHVARDLGHQGLPVSTVSEPVELIQSFLFPLSAWQDGRESLRRGQCCRRGRPGGELELPRSYSGGPWVCLPGKLLAGAF